jgi:predicted  nucleic acid-binding Zn-ribbon protein
MFSVSFEVIAMAALATSLVALLMVFSANARLRDRLERQQDALKALRTDVNAVCAGAVSVGEHLAQLEQRAHQLVQRQDQLEMHEPSGQSYRHAVKMLRKGVELDEVISDCGLARGEAELIALAQRLDKAS